MDDIADQPTISLWRDRVPRVGRGVIALVALAGLLFGSGAYGIGYALGHAHATVQASGAPLGALATPTQGPWHVYWRHDGHGRALVTPPSLDTSGPGRIMLAWGCAASPSIPRGATILRIALSQPANAARSIPLASLTCPGYGDVVLRVGPDFLADSLHYGGWGVLVDMPGDASWIVTTAVRE